MDREERFEEDPRYRQCNREAWISAGVFVVSFIVIGVVSLLVGYNRPADEIRLIAGFPGWFFYGVVVGGVLIALLPIPVVMLFFKEMSIQADEGGDDR
jgi:uncharacterized membrane protein YhdT